MSKAKQIQRGRKVHGISGMVISIFVAMHLFNHLMSLGGPEVHNQTMNMLRPIYRNIISESLLLLAVLLQIVTGIQLFLKRRKQVQSPWERIQLYSGLYMAVFLLIHVGAVLGGRYVLGLNTNFHFASAGLNSFPFLLFFIPYYSLAILALWGHIAAIHAQKMKIAVLGISQEKQAFILLGMGAVIALLILWGFTNGFAGHSLPSDYQILIGK